MKAFLVVIAYLIIIAESVWIGWTFSLPEPSIGTGLGPYGGGALGLFAFIGGNYVIIRALNSDKN